VSRGAVVEPVRRIAWPPANAVDAESIVMREWLVTNGLGGYASGTVSGEITRRYHGLLIAALPAPLGRTVMLSHLAEQVRFSDGRRIELGAREQSSADGTGVGCRHLTEFRLENGLPVWRFDVEGAIIEKRLFMPYRQNTVVIVFALLGGADRLEMALRPSVNFRAQELPVSEPLASPYEFRALGSSFEIALAGSPVPALRLRLSARDATFTLKGLRLENVLYPVEESRGYQAKGVLWSPGYCRFTLEAGHRAALVASTESFDTMSVLAPDIAWDAERTRRRRLIAHAVPAAQGGIAAELTLAADQFVITPVGRTNEVARAHAYGDEVRTVIAGYHWFTDWGRDTMISLEGLTLVTGRHVEAGYILRTFAHYVRNGLIPNLFPEGQNQGLYHTADATLWFFHALSRYVDLSGDHLTLQLLFPTLKTIIDAHVRGTDFGIRVDPHDGLLTQGAAGYQLTWMDAKVDDWVVTPRRGKPVEINALWYNALRLMEGWSRTLNDAAANDYADRAHRAYESFNQRFWCAAAGHLYDVVDPDDAKCRPNQVLAISLPHPVLQADHWQAVMQVVRDRLLTPIGLRSLAPGDPDYKPKYFGDLRTRDAAYHQGTVWGWLVGPFVDAWLKVFPHDVATARRALDGFVPHLDVACIGSVSEVFDAEEPFTPRGCVAQAWSVAELLRVWLKLAKAHTAASAEAEPVASALP
jgi:predicted glycogen debranching enzyme